MPGIRSIGVLHDDDDHDEVEEEDSMEISLVIYGNILVKISENPLLELSATLLLLANPQSIAGQLNNKLPSCRDRSCCN